MTSALRAGPQSPRNGEWPSPWLAGVGLSRFQRSPMPRLRRQRRRVEGGARRHLRRALLLLLPSGLQAGVPGCPGATPRRARGDCKASRRGASQRQRDERPSGAPTHCRGSISNAGRLVEASASSAFARADERKPPFTRGGLEIPPLAAACRRRSCARCRRNRLRPARARDRTARSGRRLGAHSFDLGGLGGAGDSRFDARP